MSLVEAWRERFAIERLSCLRARVQDVAKTLNALPAMPTFVTFVHAHVPVDDVLGELRWDTAFTLACCVPGKQLSQSLVVAAAGTDMSVLSDARQYQVLRPR